jgi:hypothetical protein
MQRTLSFALFSFFICLIAAPTYTSAAVWSKPFEISGWIPYWKAASGTADIMPNLQRFTEVNPFGYTVDDDGRLNDAAVLSQEPWITLQKEAKANHVRYIPTVMWSDADAMHAVLKDFSCVSLWTKWK